MFARAFEKSPSCAFSNWERDTHTYISLMSDSLLRNNLHIMLNITTDLRQGITQTLVIDLALLPETQTPHQGDPSLCPNIAHTKSMLLRKTSLRCGLARDAMKKKKNRRQSRSRQRGEQSEEFTCLGLPRRATRKQMRCGMRERERQNAPLEARGARKTPPNTLREW